MSSSHWPGDSRRSGRLEMRVALFALDDLAGRVASFGLHSHHRAQALPAVVASADVAQPDAPADRAMIEVCALSVAILGGALGQQTLGLVEQRGLGALETKDVVQAVGADVLRVVLRARSCVVGDDPKQVGPTVDTHQLVERSLEDAPARWWTPALA